MQEKTMEEKNDQVKNIAQETVEEAKQETASKKKKFKIRMLLVIIVLVVFSIMTFVSNRAEYLKIKEIDEKYTSIFIKNFYMKAIVFAIGFFVAYVLFYINNKIIHKGLRKFFDEEKRIMPKLPNKSICFICGILSGIMSLKFLYTKYIICANAASFGITDPIFNMDIGFYMFILPFIKAVLLYVVVFVLIMVSYTAIYYVISINVCFDKGINMDSLKSNTLISQLKFWAIIFAIFISAYLLVAAQDILTGDMINIKDSANTTLTGAGLADTFIKLWGYRIFSVVVLISVINIVRNAGAARFKKCIAAASVIPLYLFVMFGILIYFQEIYVGSSELDKEKTYIKYNIETTKEAYGIDIEPKLITNYDAITEATVRENEVVINNIPIFNEEVIGKTIADNQGNETYYKYDRSNLGVYNSGSKKLLSLTAREMINDSNRSYNNKTFEYTHGYSVVVTNPNEIDKNGYVTMLQTDFNSRSSDIVQIREPRIYFGMETNSEIIVNSKFGSEFDYPITSTTNEKFDYDGSAGLNLTFLDRLVLGLDTGNYKLAFSKYIDKDSKIITTRNILERVKLLLPYIEYDEDPYLVVTDSGSLVWVIDGYTTSSKYPYSQITTITKSNGNKEKINYIRNSVKVLVDSYTGETKFYITDRNDPIIMMYRNLYPDLFMDLDESIPESIKANLLYPQYLFDIQANVIKTYHDITEDTLYRADDVWALATDGEERIGSKYTMMKTLGMNTSNLGLITIYTKEKKESLNSYLVGYYDMGTPKLSLYKFSSDSSIIGVAQLNSLIEEDETISGVLKSLDVSGVDMVRDIIIVPIGSTLLYIEPIYQVRLNEEEPQVLKKVIVASGNKVTIGDNLYMAIQNLLSDQNFVRLEYIDMEDIDQVIDSIIDAHNNFQESLDSGDLELVGKDLSTLETLLEQLEVLRAQELKENGGKVRNESTK